MNNHTISCGEEYDFQGFLDQQMTLPERVRLERHLKECPCCAKRVSGMEKLFQQLEQSCSPTTADRISSDSLRQVMSRLGKATAAPLPGVQDTGALFDLLSELRRLHKTLLGGGAVLALLVLMAVGAQFFSSSPVVRPGDTVLPIERFSVSPFVNEGMGKVGGSMNGEVPQVIEAGSMYALSGKTHVQVALSPAQKLDFLKCARFSVTRLGVSLEIGEVRCELDQVPGFTVKSPHGSIVTVGTIFSVEVASDSTHVSLEKGVVQLKTSRQQLEIKAPAQMRLTMNGSIETIETKTDASVPLLPVNHRAGFSGKPSVSENKPVLATCPENSSRATETANSSIDSGKTGGATGTTANPNHEFHPTGVPASAADSIDWAY